LRTAACWEGTREDRKSEKIASLSSRGEGTSREGEIAAPTGIVGERRKKQIVALGGGTIEDREKRGLSIQRKGGGGMKFKRVQSPGGQGDARAVS